MKATTIKSATKHAARAGTTTLKARLTGKAMRSLKRHRRLTVALTVRFTPTGGTTASKTVKVTFKESK